MKRERCADPVNDVLNAKVCIGPESVICGDMVTTGSYTGFFRVVRRNYGYEFVEPGEVLLWMQAPDASRRRGWLQVLWWFTKQQIMIQEIAFGWVKVLIKTTLLLKDALHFSHNPFGQLPALLDIRLSLFLPGRHLLQSYLFPNAFPQAGVIRIDPVQFMEGNIALLSVVTMTVKAVLFQKRLGLGLKPR